MNADCLDIVPVEIARQAVEVQRKLFHAVVESEEVAERSSDLVVRLTENLSRMSGAGISQKLCFWRPPVNELLQKKSTIEVLSASLDQCDVMIEQLRKNVALMEDILAESEATIARLREILQEVGKQTIAEKRLADLQAVYMVYEGAVLQCRVQLGTCSAQQEWLTAAKEQIKALLDLQYDLLANNKTTLAIRSVTQMLRSLREEK